MVTGPFFDFSWEKRCVEKCQFEAALRRNVERVHTSVGTKKEVQDLLVQHLLVWSAEDGLARGVDRHELCAVLGLLGGEAEDAVLVADEAHLMRVDRQCGDQCRPGLCGGVIDLDAAVR